MKGILCFGDSITFGMQENGGWCGRLKKDFEGLGKHHGVYNLGIRGETSRELLNRFKSEARVRIKYNWPDEEYLIMIAIGTNDCKGVNYENNINTQPDVFKQNINKILKQALKLTKNIIFVGLPPVDERLVHPYENTYFSNEMVEKYNKIIKDFCKKKKVKFIEIYEEMSKLDYQKLLDDGLHPNAKGYDLMYEIIKKDLEFFLN